MQSFPTPETRGAAPQPAQAPNLAMDHARQLVRPLFATMGISIGVAAGGHITEGYANPLRATASDSEKTCIRAGTRPPNNIKIYNSQGTKSVWGISIKLPGVSKDCNGKRSVSYSLAAKFNDEMDSVRVGKTSFVKTNAKITAKQNNAWAYQCSGSASKRVVVGPDVRVTYAPKNGKKTVKTYSADDLSKWSKKIC